MPSYPNTGAFYLPEVDLHDNIRVHRFDRRGKFVALLKPEGGRQAARPRV